MMNTAFSRLYTIGSVVCLYFITVHAQYQYIDTEETVAFAQCFSDVDCLTYLTGNQTLLSAKISCNPATSRCEKDTGNEIGRILSKSPDTICPLTTMTVTPFNTMYTSPSHMCDGLLIVEFQTNELLRGLLRIYSGYPLIATAPDLTTPFTEEKFVNHPQRKFYFRGLCEDVTSVTYVVFFGNSLCYLRDGTKRIKYAIGNDVTVAGGIPSCGPGCSATGFGTWQSPPFVNTPVSPGNSIQSGKTYSITYTSGTGTSQWNTWSFRNPSLATVGSSHRVPFGQIFDQVGSILQTRTGDDILSDTGSGIRWPPAGPPSPSTTSRTLSYVSGSVQLQTGIGFAIVRQASPTVILDFLQTSCQVIEGFVVRPIYLNLSSTSGMATIPGFDDSIPMFYTLEGINLNTVLVEDGFPNLFAGMSIPDLKNHPKVSLYDPFATPGSAGGGKDTAFGICSNGFRVDIDYSGFGVMPSNNFFLNLFLVDTSVEPMVLVNASISDIEIDPVGSMPSLMVTKPGFYCAILDLRLSTNRLQTCFQVGKMASTAIQVRAVVPEPYDDIPDIYQIIGFGSLIETIFRPIVPTGMIFSSGHMPRVRISKASTNTTLAAHLAFFEGDEYDLFQEDVTMQYVAQWYDEVQYARLTQYLLKRSRFNGVDGLISTFVDAAATVFGEVAMVKFQVFNGTTDENIYECGKPIDINLLSHLRLRTRLENDAATCPNERSAMIVHSIGGMPAHFNNPLFYNTLNGNLNFEPTAYFHRWINDASGDVLYAALNGYKFPAPSNVLIRVETYDITGGLSVSYGKVRSLVPDAATRVLLNDQEPICINGTQAVRIEAFIAGVTGDNNPDTKDDLIFYWQPLDVFANELYNPNEEFFDIPSDCPLLENMTIQEVHDLCYQKVINNTYFINMTVPVGNSSNITTTVLVPITENLCMGCSNLPNVYPGVDGLVLTSVVDDAFWEGVVWVSSGLINPVTNRSIYCRSANSTRLRVPRKPALQFVNLRRYSTTCIAPECFVVEIRPVIQEPYAYLEPFLEYDANPPFGSLPNVLLASNEVLVSPNVRYDITVTLTDQMNPPLGPLFDVLCPSVITYIPVSRGPFIQVIQARRARCDSPTGSVTMYTAYVDPDLNDPVPARDVCIFWPDRAPDADPFYQSFALPVNSPTSTAIPDNQLGFFEDGRFINIRGGQHLVMIYDRCPNYDNNCNNVCSTMINRVTLQFVNQLQAQFLAFQIREFVVDNFNDDGGGIVIDRQVYNEAQCYGDSYEFEFAIFDDLNDNDDGLAYPPYQVHFIEPVTNEVIAQAGDDGLIPNTAYLNTIEGFRVRLFEFVVEVPTGPDFGIRFSGNYTLVVSSLTTGCVRTFETFINMVQPFDIILTAIPTDCAFKNGGLVLQITGGDPYFPGELPAYQFPSINDDTQPGLTRFPRYITEWKTPLNPTTFITTILPILNPPGNYTVRVSDKGGCIGTASAVIESPPPIEVIASNVASACQSSQSATLFLEAKGGTGALHTEQNLTSITVGNSINFEFVASFNQTTEFYVVDSVGCRLPTPLVFVPPDPGPVNLTLIVKPSCPNIATGSIRVITDDIIPSYKWTVEGNSLLFPTGPFLSSLPSGTFVEVAATTIIGCEGSAFATIPVRNPINVVEITRTTNGTFDPPCIDIIELRIMGGFANGTNYTVMLRNDVTNATLVYDGGDTVFAYNVCRSFQYSFEILDNDMMCPVVFVSTDAFFGLGSGLVGGIPGLPPFIGDAEDLFGSGAPGSQSESKTGRLGERSGAIIGILIGVLGILGASVGFYFMGAKAVHSRSNNNNNDPDDLVL